MAIQKCMETEWNVQELILGSGDRRSLGNVFLKGRCGFSVLGLVHSYCFFLHISDKHWAFRIVLCEKMKKNKS